MPLRQSGHNRKSGEKDIRPCGRISFFTLFHLTNTDRWILGHLTRMLFTTLYDELAAERTRLMALTL